MKNFRLTWIIIVSGIAGAACMLAAAFLPDTYKALATVTFMFVLLGVAMLLTPSGKPTWKWLISSVCVFVVLAAVAWVIEKFVPATYFFLKVPVFATLAALGMILSKECGFAWAAACLAAAAAVFSAGNPVTFLLLALAFIAGSAAINVRGIKNVVVKIAAAFVVCLAFCAFK